MYSIYSATDLKSRIQKDIEVSQRCIDNHLQRIIVNQGFFRSGNLSERSIKKINRALLKHEERLFSLATELIYRIKDYREVGMRLEEGSLQLEDAELDECRELVTRVNSMVMDLLQRNPSIKVDRSRLPVCRYVLERTY